MGYLEGGRSTEPDIKLNTRMELPLWLAEVLGTCINDSFPDGLIRLSTPACLSSSVMNALRSDSLSVDLRKQSMHFYKLAQRWYSISSDSDLVIEVVTDALRQRAAAINDFAHNSRNPTNGTDVNEFLEKLDDTELGLFRASHESSKEFKKWVSIKK
ncbi:uncharacterized protein V1516DRAFT_627978 [Lipomyces oligophaga]|uniref:uncharacterized protein n=1 Tax=Lipomyces oligophaga TaxID=45792 RepID=UPI0034CD620B